MTRPRWAEHWPAEAVLLEVDGVLLDTAAGDASAWRWWAGHVGLDAELVLEAVRGVPDHAAIARLLSPCDLDLERELTVIRERRRVLLRTARRVRGAISLVRALPPRRWAIVTSAPATLLEAQLRRLRLDPPTVVVTGEDTTEGRPSPAPHLRAAEALGAAPNVCVAFESSPAGIRAAHAAGAIAVAVGSRGHHASLAAADAVRSDLGGVQVRPLDDGRLEVRAFREPRIGP